MWSEEGKLYENTPTSILYPWYLQHEEHQVCSMMCQKKEAISLMKCLTLL